MTNERREENKRRPSKEKIEWDAIEAIPILTYRYKVKWIAGDGVL